MSAITTGFCQARVPSEKRHVLDNGAARVFRLPALRTNRQLPMSSAHTAIRTSPSFPGVQR
jgi:hypothetical protein